MSVGGETCWILKMATRTERALAPVIGTVLLLGITLVLAGTVAAIATDATSGLESPSFDDSPEADFAFDQTRAGVLVTHDGGDELEASALEIHGDDTESWADSGTVSEGDQRTVAGSSVRVVYEGATLAEWSG